MLKEHPTHYVKVIGFDKELATKSNLPIATAMSVFEGPKNERIFATGK